MFKICIDKKFVEDTGQVSLTVSIVGSDLGVGKRVIPYGNTYVDNFTTCAKNWDDLEQQKVNLLRDIRKRISVIRENMKVISVSETIEF